MLNVFFLTTIKADSSFKTDILEIIVVIANS